MAWCDSTIKVNGSEVAGHFNESDNRAAIPYTDGVEAGASISVDGKSFTVTHTVNMGNRDETLYMLLSADAPKPAKAKKAKAETEGDNPQD